MPVANQAAFDFLLSRRSRPAKTLTLPVPDRDALWPILTAAARSPDHGKLEPWRFIVLERPALVRLAGLADRYARQAGLADDRVEKAVAQFRDGNLAVVVVHVPRAVDKVPAVEQLLSAGAVCLSLLNAALAAGWGANWLTGWAAHDPAFGAEALGLAAGETVAGIVHIGTETAAPPDRPRPDIAAITRWVSQ